MKTQRIKDMITGSLITAMIIGGCSTAFAKVSKMNISVNFKDIKVNVDGKELVTEKEPFIYDGTTYLPIKAVGEAIGKQVSWDSDTNTVILGAGYSKSTATSVGKVIYDENGIKITCTGVSDSKDFMGGKKIGLIIENSTSTKYTVQVRDFSVNGIMVEPVFSCDVAAGKKAIDSIDIWKNEMDKKGLLNISKAELSFLMFDSDTWTDSFNSDLIELSF